MIIDGGSRRFNPNSGADDSDYFILPLSSAITPNNVTIAVCFAREIDNGAAFQNIAQFGQNGTNNSRQIIGVPASGDVFRASSGDTAGTFRSASTTGALVDQKWYVGVGRFVSSTSRTAERTGAAVASNTQSSVPGNFDELLIARRGLSAGTTFESFCGWLQWVCFWRVAISASESVALAQNLVDPRTIRPESILTMADFSDGRIVLSAPRASNVCWGMVGDPAWTTYGPYPIRTTRRRIFVPAAGGPSDVIGSTTLTFAQTAQLGAYRNAVGSATLTFNHSARAGSYRNAEGDATLVFGQSARLGAYRNAVGAATFVFDADGTVKSYVNARAATTLTFGQVAVLKAYGNVRSSATLTFGVSGLATSYAQLRGSALLTFSPQAALKSYANLHAATTLVFALTGVLSSGSGLSASTTLRFATSAHLSGLRNARGSTTLTFGQTATLKGYVNAIASTTLTFSVNGVLKAYLQLSGATSLVFGATGNLASPFSPGTIVFGVSIERATFVIPFTPEKFTIPFTSQEFKL